MIVALLTTAWAAPACEVEAYLAWQAGPVKVRTAPGRKKVAVVEATRLDGDLPDGPRFGIQSIADGWAQVGPTERQPDLPTGWMPVDGLRVDLVMSELSPALMPPWKVPLRESPADEAPVVRTFLQEAHTARVIGCQGTWIQAAVTAGDTTTTGWLAENWWCANALSNCSIKGPPPEPPSPPAAPFTLELRVPGADEATAGEPVSVVLSFANPGEEPVQVALAGTTLQGRHDGAVRDLPVRWSMEALDLAPGALGAVFGSVALEAGSWTLEVRHPAGVQADASLTVRR